MIAQPRNYLWLIQATYPVMMQNESLCPHLSRSSSNYIIPYTPLVANTPTYYDCSKARGPRLHVTVGKGLVVTNEVIAPARSKRKVSHCWKISYRNPPRSVVELQHCKCCATLSDMLRQWIGGYPGVSLQPTMPFDWHISCKNQQKQH